MRSLRCEQQFDSESHIVGSRDFTLDFTEVTRVPSLDSCKQCDSAVRKVSFPAARCLLLTLPNSHCQLRENELAVLPQA